MKYNMYVQSVTDLKQQLLLLTWVWPSAGTSPLETKFKSAPPILQSETQAEEAAATWGKFFLWWIAGEQEVQLSHACTSQAFVMSRPISCTANSYACIIPSHLPHLQSLPASWCLTEYLESPVDVKPIPRKFKHAAHCLYWAQHNSVSYLRVQHTSKRVGSKIWLFVCNAV